jgi:hypothetical protein
MELKDKGSRSGKKIDENLISMLAKMKAINELSILNNL